jgi:hypothetical protein
VTECVASLWCCCRYSGSQRLDGKGLAGFGPSGPDEEAPAGPAQQLGLGTAAGAAAGTMPASVDKEIWQYMRRLSKRDPVTKQKALQVLYSPPLPQYKAAGGLLRYKAAGGFGDEIMVFGDPGLALMHDRGFAVAM